MSLLKLTELGATNVIQMVVLTIQDPEVMLQKTRGPHLN